MALVIALIIFFLIILLAVGFTAHAQVPIPMGTPWYAPGMVLPQPPNVGPYLIPVQSPQPPPTWTPVPPIGPTSTPFGYFSVYLTAPAPVYTCPSTACPLITTLRAGTRITVRWAGPGWLQIESGYAAGSYIRDSASIEH